MVFCNRRFLEMSISYSINLNNSNTAIFHNKSRCDQRQCYVLLPFNMIQILLDDISK